MLRDTLLEHSRATVLAETDLIGVELVYLLEPIELPAKYMRVMVGIGSAPANAAALTAAAMAECNAGNSSYNERRRSVHWAVEAAEAREQRLSELIVPEDPAAPSKLCPGSRRPLPGEKANARFTLMVWKDLLENLSVDQLLEFSPVK